MNNSGVAPVTDSFETAAPTPTPKPQVKATPPAPKPKPSLPTIKPVVPKPLPPQPQPVSRPSSGLDWLEQNMTSRRSSDDVAKKAQLEQDKKQQEQLEKMKELDKKRSRQMYEEIQQQIMMVRKKKKLEPEKYITGATGYDPQQHQDPETFWDKMKKKQAETKKKLPWTSKQGMGTGEITRGVSG